MDKKTVSLILNIIKTVISLALCVTATVSMLGATLITVARDYLQSEQFQTQVDTTDLGSVQFMMNGQKTTVNAYAREMAAEYIKDKMPSLSIFSNYAVDQFLSSELVNSTVKTEVYYIVDYFLNTTVEDAQYRIDNNITLENREELNVDNAQNNEEAVSIYIRKMVFTTIEEKAGMSTDSLIILVSEETISKFITVAVISILVLIIINIKTIFNNLLYGGIIGFFYGIVIKNAQSKFEDMYVGNQDLVDYIFAKPLVDEYSQNALIAFIVGAVLVALFGGVYLLFKFVVNNKTEE